MELWLQDNDIEMYSAQNEKQICILIHLMT